jgi:beta-glucanase (GH16 family)
MALLSISHTKSSLAMAGLLAFLTSCGGGSTENGTSASASSSGAASQLRAESVLVDGSAQPAAAASASASGASTSSTEGPAGQDASGYTLTFHDSFDGELDRSVWNTQRFASQEATTNYATRNGTLKIWPERGRNGEFFDRTFDTDGHFTQRYGYFEIEAKLPKGKGVWPAFWLFNQIGNRRPEIDIMEAYPGGEAPWGGPGADGVPVPLMYAPVVWSNGGERAGYGKIATPDLSAGFHRYGVKWEPNRVTFYFDGREGYSLDVAVSDPMYMILDVWYGSASGSTDASTPAGEGNALEVNYIKAWQFK